MSLWKASERIKALYRESSSDDRAWSEALAAFSKALDEENDVSTLETCVVHDVNWELPVDLRLDLLKKTKKLGCESKQFLIDFYGYTAAHLDPQDEEHISAKKELDKLLSE